MTFLNYLEVKVKGQGHFKSDKVKKASNVARDPISPNQNNILGVTPSWISSTYGLAWRVYCHTFKVILAK